MGRNPSDGAEVLCGLGCVRLGNVRLGYGMLGWVI
jgi:hypothetical protein